jgi:hypothetical protein
MRRLQIAWWCSVLAACIAAAYLHLRKQPEGKELEHVQNKFEFVIDAPPENAFPLFGANKERIWAPDWKPDFIHPSPAEDVEGAVFRVKHGHHEAVWVNTVFDGVSGHVQYVYVLPDVMVTRIDIHLRPLEAKRTRAEVVYERTALRIDANDMVMHHGQMDSKAGPEWEAQINGYLKKGNT